MTHSLVTPNILRQTANCFSHRVVAEAVPASGGGAVNQLLNFIEDSENGEESGLNHDDVAERLVVALQRLENELSLLQHQAALLYYEFAVNSPPVTRCGYEAWRQLVAQVASHGR